MPANLTLKLATTSPTAAEFHLLDGDGILLAFHAVDFAQQPASLVQGAFDLRDFLSHYQGTVTDIGVFIADALLGPIFPHLANSQAERTLLLHLPDPANDRLAAALARIPWEIAQAAPDGKTLAQMNLQIRAATQPVQATAAALPLNPGEPVKVLLVFAEAPGGGAPLAMRQERLELLELFSRDIFPKRKITLDILAHGVTRERLRRQVEDRNGYHLLHWSGHGHIDCLELYAADGDADLLSGAELAALFADAGGYIPQLVFLSACHSGDLGAIRNWDEFRARVTGENPRAAAEGRARAEQSARPLAEHLQASPGYTGTAHRLLQSGTPAVVAMRYAIGDDYARHLAREFYRHLLADETPKRAAAALNLARNQLRRDDAKQPLYAACDHATPILHGADIQLKPATGRSRHEPPRPPLKIELTAREHRHFVGRIQPLALLGGWFGEAGDACPVALIQGLGGLGKTALAAEALDVWHRQFAWVLAFQSKPEALAFETFLSEFHRQLNDLPSLYAERIKTYPNEAVWQSARDGLRGEARYEKLRDNLLLALRDEHILLVLDNFERNLKTLTPGPSPAGRGEQSRSQLQNPIFIEGTAQSASPCGESGARGAEPVGVRAACQDPEWDKLLSALPEALAGTGSRVLITCRHRLAAVGDACRLIRLDTLSAGEAALFARSHPALRRLMYDGDFQQNRLAQRILNASRGHPLLLDRLARLAGLPQADTLQHALTQLESRADFAQLPELFAASAKHRDIELAYLLDALHTSLDDLLQLAGAQARHLLWVLSLADDPVPEEVLRGVWLGQALKDESATDATSRHSGRDAGIQATDGNGPVTQIPDLVEVVSGGLPSVDAGFMSAYPARHPSGECKSAPSGFVRHPCRNDGTLHQGARVSLSPASPEPDLNPPLNTLLAYGLATQEAETYTCHELTRERIAAWMDAQPAERLGRDATQIGLAYAERWAALFHQLFHQNQDAALELGRRALIGCVRAGAFERLGGFASHLTSATRAPRVLNALLPSLETAAALAPAGQPRWCCRTYLADALNRAGQYAAACQLYAEAEAEARAQPHWADVAWISGNWAGALRNVGELPAAREQHLASAEAERRAGRPEIHALISELEALRIAIQQGKAAEVQAAVEAGLAQIEDWQHRAEAGETVAQAPDREVRLRALVSALDIATDAHYAQDQWPAALDKLERSIAVKQQAGRSALEIAVTRLNRATVWQQLRDYPAAQDEWEALLDVFEAAGDHYYKAKTRSSLASLFDDLGDTAHAVQQERRALALSNDHEDIADRAISHNNLANYLEKTGALAESAQHQLAALAYFLAAGLEQHLQTSLGNYAFYRQQARANGSELHVPKLADLLAHPHFTALQRWLQQRGIAPADLQAAIDETLAGL